MAKYQSVDDTYGSAVYNIDEGQVGVHIQSMRDCGCTDYALVGGYGFDSDGNEYATLLYDEGTGVEGITAFIEVTPGTIKDGLVVEL